MAGTVSRGVFGFTNSQADFDAVVAWRDAAIADGWSHEPTYPNHEGEDRACSLKRDGYHAIILTRKHKPGGKWEAEAQVSLWGPDRLAIVPPNIYDWRAINAGVTTCGYCGATDVETERVAFANRACKQCAPKERSKLPRNWCD